MSRRLKGGRPKNRSQGIYWVQRHREDVRRAPRIESFEPSAKRSGPDAFGWLFLVGITVVIIVALNSARY
jgi:hypothetical protein